MNVLRFILQKEFRQIFRDKSILAMMFTMPIVQLVILPLAMDFDIKNIKLSIIDHDHSSYSQKLIHKIGASGYFKLISMDDGYQQAIVHLEKEEADVIMEIPSNFERNLVREGTERLAIYADAINGTKAGIGSGYLTIVINDFSKELDFNIDAFQKAKEEGGMLEIRQRSWFNPLEAYKFNIVPAVLVLLLTLIGCFMTALNIVREKEIGTIEQINVTPIKKWQFILGKMIPFWVIGMFIFTIGLAVCYFVYGIYPQGSLFLLYLFACFYLIAVLGFGLLISTFSDNQVQAMFIAFFFMTIFMLMSGFFTATDSMPVWARALSDLTPVTHFVKVVRMIMLKNSGFQDVAWEFFYLIGFGIALNGWAIWNYRKTS
ncbi:ABC transporter permease [Olivibacter ginsenosidimutans]|uniref:ABC transporter permease n=1 Tax=Olivibacter ginsenosidimutans TaxID=1176537 RepID=A0ABP9BBP9_9SPHI